MKNTFPIVHNEEKHRFEINVNSHNAILDYYTNDKNIIFTHTGVPPALEGHGIGSALVEAGLAYAYENKLQVTSLCWFVSNYMQRHPEWNLDINL